MTGDVLRTCFVVLVWTLALLASNATRAESPAESPVDDLAPAPPPNSEPVRPEPPPPHEVVAPDAPARPRPIVRPSRPPAPPRPPPILDAVRPPKRPPRRDVAPSPQVSSHGSWSPWLAVMGASDQSGIVAASVPLHRSGPGARPWRDRSRDVVLAA